MRRLKILYIMPFVPHANANGTTATRRNYHLLKALSKQHEITLVVFGTPGDGERVTADFKGKLQGVHVIPFRWLERYSRLGQFYTLMMGRSYRKRIQRTLDILFFENDYDIIHAELPVMGMLQFNSDATTILDFPGEPHPSLIRTLYAMAFPFRNLAPG